MQEGDVMEDGWFYRMAQQECPECGVIFKAEILYVDKHEYTPCCDDCNKELAEDIKSRQGQKRGIDNNKN